MVNRRITTISFDADDTLWDFDKVMRHSLGITLTELRSLIPRTPDTLTVDTMVTIRDQVAEELKGIVTDPEVLRYASFKKILQHVGIWDDDLAGHLNTLYLKHRYEDMVLFDDVIPTLDALRGRYKLGIISNGNSDPEKCGLEGRFQIIVFAHLHGVEKPDPRLFEIAMNQAGTTPDELIHVGDSLQTDVEGANRAGVYSIWLNRQGRTNQTNIQPDFEIGSLAELLGLCERMA